MGPLLIVLVLALGAANVATVVSSTFHDLAFGIVERALLIFGADVAEKALHKSMKRQSEAHTRKATAMLVDENQALKTKTKQLGQQKADLDAKHAKALADTDALKVAHANTQRELGEIRLKRTSDSQNAKKLASSVRKRLTVGLAREKAALPAEAIPYIGVGVMLTITALDVYDACLTMKEINELLKSLGQGEEKADFCGKKLPTLDEVLSDMRKDWRTSAESVAKSAKDLSIGVAIPAVRLPSADEAKKVLCPLIGNAAWIAC